MPNAYACRISRENFGAIASEKPNFSLEEIEQWLEDHEEGGFFIRDEGYAFDCAYLADIVFHQCYLFENFKRDEIFHRIMRL